MCLLTHNANVLDLIYQPGPYDGGTSSDEIAKLSTWIPLRQNEINLVDAALARPNNVGDVSPAIYNIGRVAGDTVPRLGARVKKSSRTTGLTYGTITILQAYVQVNYGNLGTLTFDEQIVGYSEIVKPKSIYASYARANH
jgi:hypothetical protein